MYINLESKKFKVINMKKSNSRFLSKTKIGDILHFSIPIKEAGSGRGKGTYASYIYIRNLTNGVLETKSFNQIGQILDRIEIIEESQ